jgi:hypothetical protein
MKLHVRRFILQTSYVTTSYTGGWMNGNSWQYNSPSMCSSLLLLNRMKVIIRLPFTYACVYSGYQLQELAALNMMQNRSQRSRGLRHELSSLARTLGSLVRILLKAWMFVFVRLFCVCAVLCLGSDLATCWSPVQGVLPTVYRIKKLKKRPSPNKGLQSHNSIQFIFTCKVNSPEASYKVSTSK